MPVGRIYIYSNHDVCRHDCIGRGDGMGAGMMSGLFALFTFPVVSIGTWFLYPRKAYRIAIYCITLLGLIPFITTIIIVIKDYRTPMTW